MKYIELTQLTFNDPEFRVQQGGRRRVLREQRKNTIMINFDKVYSFSPYGNFVKYSKIEMENSVIIVEESYDTIKDKLK
jgi:hypothetical protein